MQHNPITPPRSYLVRATEIKVALCGLDYLPLHFVFRGDGIELTFEDLCVSRVSELVGLDRGTEVSLASLVCQVVQRIFVGRG